MYKVKYAISKTKDGNMSFKYGDPNEVIKNRETFLSGNNFQIEDTVSLVVEMKDNVVLVDEKDKGKGIYNPSTAIPCDALVTHITNLSLFLMVADCLPVILLDENNGVLSLIHGGWPNTDLHIYEKVLEKMNSSFNTENSNVKVIIGPGIQKKSLIYDRNIFKKITTDWGKYIKDLGNEKYSIDNVGYAKEQLLEASIPESNISIDYTDVAKSNEYFSHSRDFHNGVKDNGRFGIVATMYRD